MKNIKEFINESINNDVTVEEIASIICCLAADNEDNIKMMSADEIMNYSDEVEIAQQLQQDQDEISDFIQDNYEAIVKEVNKLKKEY